MSPTNPKIGPREKEANSAPAKPDGQAVRLLVVDIDALRPSLEQMTTLLSPDELARAARFHFEKDQVRFVLGRATLRLALSAHCDEAPERLGFDYGTQGKPSLAGQGGDLGLCFNASGSDGLVAIAVARGASLGVDIERVRELADWRAIARRFFAENDRQGLSELDPGRQEDAFFRVWTLKESVAKFTGYGLSLGLDKFGVSVPPGGDPKLASWSAALASVAPPGSLWTRPLADDAHISLACSATEIVVELGIVPPALKQAALAWPSL